MRELVWENIQRVRNEAPLIHNITNAVVMNNTANALLAAGASPIMAHALEEIDEMVPLCRATVINIGTLDRFTVESMKAAIRRANEVGRPVVLDPVGAGATSFRNRTLQDILASGKPQFIRGNASEIMVMSGLSTRSKGVDSSESSLNSLEAAKALSKRVGCIVCVSGETDLVVEGDRVVYLYNGSPMMEKVTGLGCTASAILGAFAAVSEDTFMAAVSATSFMGVCGEIAVGMSQGPGTLQLHLYDVMYNLNREQFMQIVRISE